MKILLISDSHGRKNAVEQLICGQNCDFVFFLGDGVRDVEDIDDSIIKKVSGNCDLFSFEATTRYEILEGFKIMLTHGHEYKAKLGLETLAFNAKNNNCQIVVFGHIHTQTCEKINDILLINPGAFKNGEYAILTLAKNKEPVVEFKKIDI